VFACDDVLLLNLAKASDTLVPHQTRRARLFLSFSLCVLFLFLVFCRAQEFAVADLRSLPACVRARGKKHILASLLLLSLSERALSSAAQKQLPSAFESARSLGTNTPL